MLTEHGKVEKQIQYVYVERENAQGKPEEHKQEIPSEIHFHKVEETLPQQHSQPALEKTQSETVATAIAEEVSKPIEVPPEPVIQKQMSSPSKQ